MAQGVKTVDDDEIIETMREHFHPAFSTQELAEEFGMTEQGMRNRLEKLAEEGDIHKKKPSARTVLWWVDEDHYRCMFSE